MKTTHNIRFRTLTTAPPKFTKSQKISIFQEISYTLFEVIDSLAFFVIATKFFQLQALIDIEPFLTPRDYSQPHPCLSFGTLETQVKNFVSQDYISSPI